MQIHFSDTIQRNPRPTLAEVIAFLDEKISGNSDTDHDSKAVSDSKTGSKLTGHAPIIVKQAVIRGIFHGLVLYNGMAVPLPTSRHFMAQVAGAAEKQKFCFSKLIGARLDFDGGQIKLADGRCLRLVEFIPVPLRIDPTALDWQIMRGVIAVLGLEEVCYQRFSEQNPELFRSLQYLKEKNHSAAVLSDPLVLDFSALRQLTVRPTKDFLRDLGRKDPALKNLSRPKLIHALEIFQVTILEANRRQSKA